jgi:hypothetical protein
MDRLIKSISHSLYYGKQRNTRSFVSWWRIFTVSWIWKYHKVAIFDNRQQTIAGLLNTTRLEASLWESGSC